MTLTVHGGRLELPLLGRPPRTRRRSLAPGSRAFRRGPDRVVWRVERDVLRRTTTWGRARLEYGVPHDGTAREDYPGRVEVDRRTFAQHAEAAATFELRWPGTKVLTTS